MKEFYYLILLNAFFVKHVCPITMEQFKKSLDMMRNGCHPKFPKIPVEDLDKFRNGELPEVTKDFKCYIRCVAQLAGVLTKKGEIGIQKTLSQMMIIVPKELHETTGAAVNHCEDVQKDIKDSCEKTFTFTKCLLEFNPSAFTFP